MAEPLNIPQLTVSAVVRPREAYREVLAMGLGRGAMWQILLLLAIGRSLLIGAFDGARFVIPFGTTPIVVSPVSYTMILIVGFVVMVYLVHHTGRLMGGTGSFDGAMAVAILLEGLALVLVVLQIVLGWISPVLVGILGLISLPVMLYCALSYIDELHGFDSMLKAFGMIVLAILGLSLGITVLVSVLGAIVGVPGV